MPLTVDDLAGFLTGGADATAPAVGTQRRAEMQRALDTAVAEVTRMTGWLDAVTATATVSTDGRSPTLNLPYVRLASVGTITGPGGVVTPGYVDPLAGVVEVSAYASRGVWSIVCTGTAWNATLQQAALELAAHLADAQRRAAQSARDDTVPAPSFALPNRVVELLTGYLLPGAA